MVNRFKEGLMLGGALRHVVASLPPEAARALAALVDNLYSDQDRREVLADLRREGLFNAGSAQAMLPDDAIALASFRYHLGRMTSAVQICTEWLAGCWSTLGDTTQATIVGEIRTALDNGAAGQACDAAAWRHLLDKVSPQLAYAY